MKKLIHLRTYRYLLLVLIVVMLPVSGQSSQVNAPALHVPSLFIQAQHLVQTRLAFAFPPPLAGHDNAEAQTPSLRIYALLQVFLLTLLATWWRLRLGHWGLR